MILFRSVICTAAILLIGACSSPDGVRPEEPTSTSSASPADTKTASETDAQSSTLRTPSSSSSEANSTPSASEAIGDDAAREDAVVPAFREYWDVINATYAAGGSPEATDEMMEVMLGGQLAFWEETFARFDELDRRYEGENVVTSATPVFVDLGPDSGDAEVKFCVDMSGTTAFESDGSPMVKDGYFQEGVAGMTWIDGRWKVAGFTKESGVVSSC